MYSLKELEFGQRKSESSLLVLVEQPGYKEQTVVTVRKEELPAAVVEVPAN